ncbi:ADP-ribosylglycohydrolase family protein [Candidatus Sumerlaeota bacterium]|nr:ADP-ribosylglycohydrolase family protein [Candidatus Sumerlaeales bacterium]NLD61387.1 ADP-ribosylglycohydrolase family protein [Candidatus Sumerlaeota bacterium]
MQKRFGLMFLMLFSASVSFGASEKWVEISDEDYLDHIRACWVAKCAGGAMGMPVECWDYKKIEARYPKVDGYIGYFQPLWEGWSGFLGSVKVPADGKFHDLVTTVTMPNYPVDKFKAIPIVGLSLEMTTSPAEFQIEAMDVSGPSIPLGWPLKWRQDVGCLLEPNNKIFGLSFDGLRAWVKGRSDIYKLGDFVPGKEYVFTIRAKRTSGTEERLGVAFDYCGSKTAIGFGPDDDTSYQVSSLLAMEKYGPGVTSDQMAELWAATLPEISPLLAEGVGLANIRKGIKPPECGKKDNHSAEAIGGQMRGEIWGMLCPGRPDLAAEYSRRDAVLTHWRNGVYGEQFVAAMIAESFRTKDVEKLIDTGLQYIPADCEYASVVNYIKEQWKAKRPWKEVRNELIAKYPGTCNPVYAECGIITLALLYGEGNWDKTLHIAFYCGSDTDCNCATVCGVLGAINGQKFIAPKWSEPIGDVLRCFVKGHEEWSITELCKRIETQYKLIKAYHGDGNRFAEK